METALKAEIVAMGHQLIEKNLVAGSWGNISLRKADEIAITPSGHGYETLKAEQVVVLDLEGKILEGTLPPSSEAALHLSIYKACPEAGAIIHTHSIYASALAAMHKPVPALIEDIVQICGGRVNCAQYAICGTQALADCCVAALEPEKGTLKKKACLMANHGAVVWGKNLKDALIVAQVLEKAAQIAIICQQCGGAYELGQEDVEEMHQFYQTHYNKRQLED